MTEPGRAGARLASRVAARTAHDLNNIAAVVSGHIYLLRSGAEPMEEAFEAMEKAMEHMERLTRSLTALGTLGLEPVEATDVNEALRETLAGAGAGGVELDLDPELPKLSTRRADLIRAVDALVQQGFVLPEDADALAHSMPLPGTTQGKL